MKMSEHPIENLMITAMSSIQNMIDVNTIIGEPIEAGNGITIIPISKVCFGFASGGSEFNGETIKEYNKKDKEEEIEYKLPFGGGAGAGVSIHPVSFLVVQDKTVKLMPVDHESCIDKLLDYVPDLLQKMNDMFNKSMQQQENKTNKIIEEMKNRNSTASTANSSADSSSQSTNKPKSPEVKGQDIKIQENEEQSEYDEIEDFLEEDGEDFG